VIFPPSIVRVRVVRAGRKRLSVWLPVLLLWPLVAVLGVLAWLVVALVVAVRAPRELGRVVRAGLWLVVLFCRLRGLRLCLGDAADGALVHVI
jgi:hypothetical protein